MNSPSVILSVLLLVMGCSLMGRRTDCARESQGGQVVYEKNCLRCHGSTVGWERPG